MKIVQLLEQVGSDTWKSFDLFLRSPYHNQDERLVQYFVVLCKDIKEGKEISKEHVWIRLFPNQKFNDAKFRQITHRLLNLYKNFLCSESLKNDSILSHRLLAKWSRDKNLTSLKNELQRIEKTFLTKMDFNESSNLIDLSLANDAIYRIEHGYKRINSYLTEEVQSRMVLSKYLIQANTTISLIALYLISQNHNEISNTDEFILAEDIDESVEVGLISSVPLYQLYISIFKMYKYQSSTADISECVEVLSYFVQRPNEEIKALYTYIHNFLVRALNKGQNVGQQLYEVLIFGLDSQIVVSNEIINTSEFLNVVNLASRIHGKKKAFDVIESYSNLLSKKDYLSVTSYAKATVLMRARSYEEVISVLQNVEYDNLTIAINARHYQIIAFLALQDYEVCLSSCRAFKIFLRRNRKISKEKKEGFLRFCSVIIHLINTFENSDIEKLMKAQEIIDDDVFVPASWWLKEKIEEASQLLGIKSAEL